MEFREEGGVVVVPRMHWRMQRNMGRMKEMSAVVAGSMKPSPPSRRGRVASAQLWSGRWKRRAFAGGEKKWERNALLWWVMAVVRGVEARGKVRVDAGRRASERK